MCLRLCAPEREATSERQRDPYIFEYDVFLFVIDLAMYMSCFIARKLRGCRTVRGQERLFNLSDGHLGAH